MSEHEELDAPRILDADGTPIPPRVTLRDRWRRASSRVKALSLGGLAVLGGAAALATNVDVLVNWFGLGKKPVVPSVTMTLSNGGSAAKSVFVRSDFVLILPGQDEGDQFGKYELESDDREMETIEVPPNQAVTAATHIMNQEFFAEILDDGDCDVRFQLRVGENAVVVSEKIPFTRGAADDWAIDIELSDEVSSEASSSVIYEPDYSEWGVSTVPGPSGRVHGEEPHVDGIVSTTIPDGCTMLPETLEREGGSPWGRWYDEDPSITNGGKTITARYKNWKREGSEIRIRVMYVRDE